MYADEDCQQHDDLDGDDISCKYEENGMNCCNQVIDAGYENGNINMDKSNCDRDGDYATGLEVRCVIYGNNDNDNSNTSVPVNYTDDGDEYDDDDDDARSMDEENTYYFDVKNPSPKEPKIYKYCDVVHDQKMRYLKHPDKPDQLVPVPGYLFDVYGGNIPPARLKQLISYTLQTSKELQISDTSRNYSDENISQTRKNRGFKKEQSNVVLRKAIEMARYESGKRVTKPKPYDYHKRDHMN